MCKSKVKILIPLLVVLLCVVGCFGYLNNYYRTDVQAVAAFNTVTDIKTEVSDSGTITYIPENPVAGLIFYPGGKVEYTAYEPLMKKCAEKGILCVLLKMPFNLAVFDMDAAQGISEQYPEITKWYLGGHSLGGAMAASYLSQTEESYDGIVLLAAYSTADLKTNDVDVLSVFGSEDGVMNKEKYEQYKPNLPEDFTEAVIDGGNHALFGVYGEQQGDGIAEISNQEQIDFTASQIEKFITEN